jgi:outer membrane immunogenic protein
MRRFSCALLAAVAVIGFASVTHAADMPVKAPPSPPPVAAPSWTGFYIGGDLGGAWTRNTGTFNPLPTPAAFGFNPATGGDGGSAFIGGFHAGYHYQFAPAWVAGLEGDWSWTSAGGSFSQPWITFPAGPVFPTANSTVSSRLDWVSSLRGRFGYLVTPNVLAYATGGVAWGKFDYTAISINNVPGGYIATAAPSSIQTGFTLGGGLEWAMTNNWLVRAEYLYYRFSGAPNIAAAPPPIFGGFLSGFAWSSTNVSVARAGLSYKF